jgi:hypothetical protein
VATRKPKLVVFADDWGRHPSSAQHLARSLRRRYQIDWVNITGTRRPGPLLADFRRGIEKLQHWMRPALRDDAQCATSREMDASVFVHSPIHWPGFGSRLERLANANLLEVALSPLLTAGPEPAVVITTHPLVADLVSRYPRLNWAYYIVDDLSVWVTSVKVVEFAVGAEVATAQAALGGSCGTSLAGVGMRISPIASMPM